MKRNLLIAIGCLLALSGCNNAKSSSELPQEAFVRQYFDAVMQGSDGIDFWCPNSSPKTLFAVQSYELIGKNTSSILGESGMWIIAQVHSSSKAGNPIVKDWQIGVKQQSTGYCIQRFLENE